MNSYSPQKWDDIKTKIKIKFESLPNLPIALEDVFGGIIDNDIIISCGFGGTFNRKNTKPYWTIYRHRDFYNNTYKLDLNNIQNGFQKIINFPGRPRQDGGSIVVNNEMYAWGGFSYTPAKILTRKVLLSKKKNTLSMKDGYKLYKENDEYKWKKLPDLPYEMCSFSLTNIDNKIYLFGGADYHDSSFYTWESPNNNIKNIGSALYVINIDKMNDGWKILNPCPGTPRMLHTGISLNEKLYFFGGASGREFKKYFCSTVDNWEYDIKKNEWKRLIDCPTSQTNWKYSVLYKNKYVLLVGGYKGDGNIIKEYTKNFGRNVINRDKQERQGYGTVRQRMQLKYLDEYHIEQDVINNKVNHIHNGTFMYGKDPKMDLTPKMCGEILAYDISKNLFYKVDDLNNDIPLPLNINLPFVIVKNDNIYIIGGESDISTYNNTTYKGYSTDVAIVGKLTEII